MHRSLTGLAAIMLTVLVAGCVGGSYVSSVPVDRVASAKASADRGDYWTAARVLYPEIQAHNPTALRMLDEDPMLKREVERYGGGEAKSVLDARASLEAETAELTAKASHGRIVRCRSRGECEKVMALAQVYIHEHADLKIQVATDTVVETYNPREPGEVGISAVKTPGAGQSATVEIRAHIRGAELLDRKKAAAVEAGFRPFVERHLKP